MRYVTALLVLATSTAVAQKTTAATTTKTVSPSAAVLRLEDDWAKGLVKRDRALFERLLAPGFIYSEDTTTIDRAAAMQSLVAGDVVTEAHNEKMEAHPFGSVIVVIGWLVVNGRDAHGTYHHRYRFTDTWSAHGTGWQIVAAHDVLVK
jgi:hypothetical protein